MLINIIPNKLLAKKKMWKSEKWVDKKQKNTQCFNYPMVFSETPYKISITSFTF
jgi:hypothetical protein